MPRRYSASRRECVPVRFSRFAVTVVPALRPRIQAEPHELTRPRLLCAKPMGMVTEDALFPRGRRTMSGDTRFNRRAFLGATAVAMAGGSKLFAQNDNNAVIKKFDPITLPLDQPGVWTLNFWYK